MAPDRIAVQYTAAVASDSDVVRLTIGINYSNFLIFFLLLKLIGSCFVRDPPGSTERYTRWCNTLSQSQLYTQVSITSALSITRPHDILNALHVSDLHCIRSYSHSTNMVLFTSSL